MAYLLFGHDESKKEKLDQLRKIVKMETPIVFISGWNQIPMSDIDGRRRMYTDDKFKNEMIKKIVSSLLNQKNNN